MLMIVRPGMIAVLFSLNLAGLSGCGPAASDHATNPESRASLGAPSQSQPVSQHTPAPRNDPFTLAASPVPLAAPPWSNQAPAAAQEKPAGKMGMPGMMGHGHMMGMMPEMQKMHEQMEQELQKKLTALREHSKTMEGISDEKQLLTEIKKHQQMTDDLLGTMLEQREKMHAQMKARHEQMQSQMGKPQQTEKQAPEGHEAPHEGK